MMDSKDAKKIIDDLQNYPFICSNTKIVTESGYVIMPQKEYDALAAAAESRRTSHEQDH